MTVEIALIGLGKAVVSSASKLWLGDSDLVDELKTDAIDMLAEKLTGEIDQRRARRLFENVVDDVAERLSPMLNTEFRRLPDHEREATILAVQSTLMNAQLGGEKIFTADLDARSLYSAIRHSDDVGARTLSMDGRELYELVLRECCGYIIEISRALPQFNQDALVQILRRETLLLSKLREVLSRLPQRSTSEFSYDYRQLVARVLDRVEVFGAPVSDTSRVYPLSVAYLSLNAAAGVAGQAGAMSPGWRVEQILAGSRRLLVRGDAGLGKSTLLQWIAVRSARRDFSSPLTTWNDTIPLYLLLRRYGDRDFPPPEKFLEEVGRQISEMMPKGWVHSELKLGNAIVLVDGIDEVARNRRTDARNWLESLVETFPNSRYVVTSRPAALDESWLRLPGFQIADLQAMGLDDIRTFVTRWHDAIAGSIQDDDAREELDGYREDLMLAIEQKDHLRRLASFPLLASLLCALNRDRHSALPANRMELYDLALDMLLERRDAERKLGALPGLNKSEKLILLSHLAYWLLRNNYVDASRTRAVQQIDTRLSGMSQVNANGETVYAHLLERSGVLREKVEGRVDFIHRSFQEFLAARAAIADDDLGTLLDRASTDAWHDVVVMAAGHAQRAQRDSLISGLLDAASAAPAKGAPLELLAVACLETSPELSPEVRARIEQRAAALVPPTKTSSADAFASAGPFVVELLATARLRTVREAAATVRALSLIGGPQALNALKKFRNEKRALVVRELVAGWRAFGQEEYAENVLSDLDIDTLSVNDARASVAVRHLKHVRNLSAPIPSSGDLGFVPKSVKQLNVSGRKVDLRSLQVAGLESFTIQTSGSVLDVSVIGRFPSLKALSIGATAIQNLHAVERLEHLETLKVLGGTIRREDLDHLPVQVREIEISGATVEGFAFAKRVQDLRALTLHFCTIASISKGGFPLLEKLRIRNCQVVNTNVEFFRQCRMLSELDLTGTQFSDISFVRQLGSLSTLTLSSVRSARDLAPVRWCNSLRLLRITAGGPIELGALAGMENLDVMVEGAGIVRGENRLGPHSRVVRCRVEDDGKWTPYR